MSTDRLVMKSTCTRSVTSYQPSQLARTAGNELGLARMQSIDALETLASVKLYQGHEATEASSDY
jgi:hypothetical protein